MSPALPPPLPEAGPLVFPMPPVFLPQPAVPIPMHEVGSRLHGAELSDPIAPPTRTNMTMIRFHKAGHSSSSPIAPPMRTDTTTNYFHARGLSNPNPPPTMMHTTTNIVRSASVNTNTATSRFYEAGLSSTSTVELEDVQNNHPNREQMSVDVDVLPPPPAYTRNRPGDDYA